MWCIPPYLPTLLKHWRDIFYIWEGWRMPGQQQTIFCFNPSLRLRSEQYRQHILGHYLIQTYIFKRLNIIKGRASCFNTAEMWRPLHKLLSMRKETEMAHRMSLHTTTLGTGGRKIFRALEIIRLKKLISTALL